MPDKEATARIKINKLLEAAGWRFFPDGTAPANIRLEPSVTIKSTDLDALGDNFEKTTKGFVDFLLARRQGLPAPRPRSQSRGQESARRQGAGPQVRQVPELPLRHPLQRQPALLLGPRTRQPLRHHLVSDTGLGHRLPEGHAQSAAPDRRAGRRGLHRSHPAPELPIGGRRGRTKRSAPDTSRPTSCAFSGPISSRPSTAFRPQSAKARTASCSRWPPAPARP